MKSNNNQKKTLIFERYSLRDSMEWSPITYWGWCPTRYIQDSTVTQKTKFMFHSISFHAPYFESEWTKSKWVNTKAVVFEVYYNHKKTWSKKQLLRFFGCSPTHLLRSIDLWTRVVTRKTMDGRTDGRTMAAGRPWLGYTLASFLKLPRVKQCTSART
jgi:hypothetical protein